MRALQPPDGDKELKVPKLHSKKPEDWLKWKEAFLRLAEEKPWTDDQKKRMIKCSMLDDAVMTVASIPIYGVPATATTPALPSLTWQEVLAAYENKFVAAAGETFARQEFLFATQQKSESIVEWHSRVITMYRHAEPFGDFERSKELRERFILGLSNKQIMEYVLDNKPPTMSLSLIHI